jgi:geranylgeranyl diphosphate synthase type I
VLAQVRRVVEYKTAKYTVVRPLQVGAALGGGSDALLDALASYGSPLGRAFQYRDDVLGVFGDEALTGKPAGDDLREGKLTLLIANAMASAGDGAASELSGLLGRELSTAEVDAARKLITESGALDATEREIADATRAAVAALIDTSIAAPAAQGLRKLAELATQRES